MMGGSVIEKIQKVHIIRRSACLIVTEYHSLNLVELGSAPLDIIKQFYLHISRLYIRNYYILSPKRVSV